MFTDHMFFSWETEMVWAIATLASFAMSYRVRLLNKTLLRTKPAAQATPTTKISFTLRNCSARSSTHFSNGAAVAGKNRDLFPLGRYAPAKGKEDTSC